MRCSKPRNLICPDFVLGNIKVHVCTPGIRLFGNGLIGHFKSYTISPQKAPFVNAETAKKALPVTALDKQEVPFITDVRTVAEHREGIGIFDCFGTLLEVYEINLDFLPPSDRQALKKGIPFDSEGEMRNFLESLDS